MQRINHFAIVALLAAPCCAAAVPTDEPGAGDVEAASAALLDACTDRIPELHEYAYRVADYANQARSYYDNDPNNANAIRYFGKSADKQMVTNTLIKIVQRGRSSRLNFECVDPDQDAECKKDATTALWTTEGETNKTDGWTIHVCGTRFWDVTYGNGSEDRGRSATRDGIMAHEISHVAGATSDNYTLDEDGLVNAMTNDVVSMLSYFYAESFRFYIMN